MLGTFFSNLLIVPPDVVIIKNTVGEMIDSLCHLCFQGRRNAQALVNPAEVAPREIQGTKFFALPTVLSQGT